MKNSKSKFLEFSKRFKILKKFYFFYNIYIRNFKFLKNGTQFGEDKYIMNLFNKNFKGKFLDVGCYHPTRHNNTYLMYKSGWSGINIDLNPLTIELFNYMRPRDVNINTGVSDTETEKKLLATVDTLAQNRTIIMITHRLSTLKGCDRVIRLHKGKIIENN